MAISAKHAIDTVESAFGRHRGYRALHAKGVVCAGVFTPTAEAAGLTRAAHMQGPDVPVTARFSNASGDPDSPDWAPDSRGLGIKFYLPDGSRTDIVAVSSPRFPTRTPEGFIELVEAQGAGARAPWKLTAWLANNPEAIRALPAVAPTLAPPVSYATIPYYAIHAYKWIDRDGGERFIRYRLMPAAGAERLTPWKARSRGRDYLQDEIRARVGGAPVMFSLQIQIAEPGDPINDPNAAWPRERRQVTVGTLRITGLDTEREHDDDVLVFDPTRVTDGIECSDDPVLRYRPPAYSESVKRRTEN